MLQMQAGKERRMWTLSEKIIALDAGHGMGTLGKRCLKSIDPLQTREWYLNDRIADMVEAELAAYFCRVVRAGDTTGARDVPRSSRVKTANTAKADIYISIHHNAGISGGTGGGVSVHYYGAGKTDRKAKAQRLYTAVVSKNGLAGNRSQKVVPGSFYVLKHTQMAALLLENGFMDSATDTPIILTQYHAEKTAQGIIAFLVDELQLVRKVDKPVEDVTDKVAHLGTYYRAYTGKPTTLSAALTSLWINSSYTFRRQIAAVNGIKGYMGTANQNTQMYNLLKAGLLKRVKT